jgi:FkbM family methyltransferase
MKTKPRGQVETLHYVLRQDWVKDWSLAIDGGANIGNWTAVLADRFDWVLAFDAAWEADERLGERFAETPNVQIVHAGLWDVTSSNGLHVFAPKKRETLSSRQVEFKKGGGVASVAIDDLGLRSLGLLKLDIEGSEWFALRGASKTILRHRPVLVVEIENKGRRFKHADGQRITARDVNDLVLGLGYREVYHQPPDKVYVPR